LLTYWLLFSYLASTRALFPSCLYQKQLLLLFGVFNTLTRYYIPSGHFALDSA
jgi:hypothetical protein